MLRRYVHVGTGNYHPKTARVYEDLGLLTSDPEIGADVADLFNHLSGYTRHRDYDTLLVAPEALRAGLLDLIAREARPARKGKSAGISIKANNLVDETIIDALYDASSAGVTIDLLVRGMCSIRPGVPGLSETIRVRSLLGRFLEHSRVFRFDSGGERTIWIGSADIMDRNLDRRVEALVRVRTQPVGARSTTCSSAPGPTRSTTGPCCPTAAGSDRRTAPDGRLSAGDHRPAAAVAGKQRRRRDRLIDRERNGGDRGCRRSRVAADRRQPASDRSGLVHRPKYDDWTLPKGKLEPDEHPLLAAVREVEEESGARVVVGRPLGQARYAVDGRPKRVQYWSLRWAGGEFSPNNEVDAVDWVPIEKAGDRLKPDRDGFVVDEFLRDPRPTRACVVVRHAKAGSRSAWKRPDVERPLDAAGRRQAAVIADLLAAYGVSRAYSSDVRRCLGTLEPFAAAAGLTIAQEHLLSESGFPGEPEAAVTRALGIVGEGGSVAISPGRRAADLISGCCPTARDDAGGDETGAQGRSRGGAVSFRRRGAGVCGS